MQFPSNVKVYEGDQGTDDWLNARLGIPTASHAGDYMIKAKNGKYKAGRKDYITQLAIERVTGELPEQVVSALMEEGKEREQVASLAYQFETGNEVDTVGFLSNDLCGASPDNLIVGQRGGVEYKNPKGSTHFLTLTTRSIPEFYYWQIIQNMYVTGYEFWDYVSYHPAFPDNAQLYIERVERSKAQGDINLLEEELKLVNREIEEQVKFITNFER
jgi:hypothetical protein